MQVHSGATPKSCKFIAGLLQDACKFTKQGNRVLSSLTGFVSVSLAEIFGIRAFHSLRKINKYIYNNVHAGVRGGGQRA